MADVARVTAGDLSLSVERNPFTDDPDGKPEWHWQVSNQRLCVHVSGNDLFGWGDAAEMLATLISFLEADGESYQCYMGPASSRSDDYLFGWAVAKWAYLNAEELNLAAIDLSTRAKTRRKDH